MGNKAEAVGSLCISDLQSSSLSQLQGSLGMGSAAAQVIWERCRGIDPSAVKEVVPQSCTVTSWLANDAFAHLAMRSPLRTSGAKGGHVSYAHAHAHAHATGVHVGGWCFEPHTAKGKSNDTRARWLVLALALDLEEKLTHHALLYGQARACIGW